MTTGDPIPVTLPSVTSSGGQALTVAGPSGVRFSSTQPADLELGALTAASGLNRLTLGQSRPSAGSTSGSSTGLDLIGTIRSNSGQVTAESGVPVAWGAGDWHPSDFNFQGNNTLILTARVQGQTTYLKGDLVVGTAPGQPASVSWSTQQNPWIGGDADTALIVDDGTFSINNSNGTGVRIAEDILLRNGARFNLPQWDGNRTLEMRDGRGLSLGDGDAGTQETIRITGLMNDSNTTETVSVQTGSGTDDGNTILQYESNAGGAGDVFNIRWAGSPFRGGSAGTIFRPDPNNLGIAAVGPDNGDVMTVDAPAEHQTAGTVGFYNSSGAARGSLGPMAVANGGSFTVAEDGGTVQAASISVENGATLAGNGTFDVTDAALDAIGISGTVSPGTSVGSLTFDGNATFEPGSELIIELESLTSYDVLEVINGDLTLNGGTLNVTIPGGYEPDPGDRFKFLKWDGVQTGQFGAINFPALPGGDMEWRTHLLYSGGTLLVTPEPATALLLLCGALGLLLRRGRRR